jgi:hypothetical protein
MTPSVTSGTQARNTLTHPLANATCSISKSQLGLRLLPPQHRALLAQHEQLGILRRRRTCKQCKPSGQANEDQVKHPYCHKPAILPAEQPSRQAYSHVSNLCTVLEPQNPVSD